MPTVHTMPVGDLVEHEMSDECICGPTCVPVLEDNNVEGWVYGHHSLDGRERDEEVVEDVEGSQEASQGD